MIKSLFVNKRVDVYLFHVNLKWRRQLTMLRCVCSARWRRWIRTEGVVFGSPHKQMSRPELTEPRRVRSNMLKRFISCPTHQPVPVQFWSRARHLERTFNVKKFRNKLISHVTWFNNEQFINKLYVKFIALCSALIGWTPLCVAVTDF